jgi:hypothetical protein
MAYSAIARTLGAFLIMTSIAYARDDGPTESPPYLIPGTDWVYVEKYSDRQTTQCEVNLVLPSAGGDGKRLFAFAIGSKGSPVIELADEFLVRPIRDTIGWRPRKSYNAVIIPETRKGEAVPIDAQGEPMNERTIIIFLPKSQRFLMNEIYNSSKLFISIGGVASKSYELPKLSDAIDKLQTCPIDHIPWPAPGIN